MRLTTLHSASLQFAAAAAAMMAIILPLAAKTPPPPEHIADHVRAIAPDPLAPAEPRAAKAFDVFDRHCARCHESRRLQARLPAAGLANILDLDALANRRDLVRPGQPDGSPLYVSMVSRRMPYDVLHELQPGAEPTPQEIADVRAWIEGLPAARTCTAGAGLSQDLDTIIETDLRRFDAQKAERRRYISLADVATPCDGPEALTADRQAATKLLNLLSRTEQPVRLEPLADSGLLLGFDLADVGWGKADWDCLFAQVPDRLSNSDGQPEARNRVIGAGRLAQQAMDQGTNARLVGLPATLGELNAAFGIDAQALDVQQNYRLDHSEVTGAARTFFRVLTPDRVPLWTAQDFAGPQPLETRAIVPLPNGFPGFALYNRDGTPRASLHASAVTPQVAQAGAASAGLRCLACHGGGLAGFKTEAAPQKAAPAEWQVARDNTAFQIAMRTAGIPLNLEIDGLEPVVALAERYRRDLGLDQAAAELGLSTTGLSDALLTLEGDLQPVARRLLQNVVTRDDFEALRRLIAAADVHGAEATASPQVPSNLSAELRLSLWTQKPVYAKGEEVTLHASTTAACRLTLVSVDASGDAVVIFPSEFQDDNLLEPGSPLTVPAAMDGFRLLVDEPGRESVIGICLAGDRATPPGIVHDFDLQRFTLLGDWRQHIARALEADAAERQKAGKPVKRTRLRRRRGRRVKPLPARATKLPLPQAWAMIVISARPGPDETSASAARK